MDKFLESSCGQSHRSVTELRGSSKQMPSPPLLWKIYLKGRERESKIIYPLVQSPNDKLLGQVCCLPRHIKEELGQTQSSGDWGWPSGVLVA